MSRRAVSEVLAVGYRVETPDGIQFVFGNDLAPVMITFLLVTA